MPLAQRLRRLIAERSETSVALGALDITFYRDDVQIRGREAPLSPSAGRARDGLDFGLEGRTCILVDDVLYTGRTIRAAIEAFSTTGGRRASSSRSSPTAATASCRSGPTTSARTCHEPGRAGPGELVEVDEVDRVLLVSAPRREPA